jgi:hypothetical protein
MRYVKKELVDGSKYGWAMINEFEDLSGSTRAEFKGGVFMAEYPGDPTTKLLLTIPSSHGNNRVDWKVVAPNSNFYPGKHAGHLIFREGFPFKDLAVYWDTLILSAFPRQGNSVADYRMFGRLARHFYSTL